MKYKKRKNEIVIEDLTEFDIAQILECGQVFSYSKIDENQYCVYSKNKFAHVLQKDKSAVIKTNDVNYFINYFDLESDYSDYKQKLLKIYNMKEEINYGHGIRILKQDVFEMIISFVISANNNIPRIKNSIKYMRENIGTNMGNYYAFPTLCQLQQCDVQFFVKAGLGYRAEQMVKLVGQLKDINIEELKTYDTQKLRNLLISLSGIGPKVADCILLFGFSRGDVFPVDTWIEKIFHDKFGQTNNRLVMREELVKKFGDLSGVAQQYLFYYKRSQDKGLS